jgi:Flp pilus assembly protein TadG
VVKRLKNRRGVTLVLMAFMLTVLIGSAAFAVDFSRMFLYRGQLHTAADAAALAAVVQIADKSPGTAQDSAIVFAGKHSVDNTTVSLAPGDVIPGHWTVAGGFVPAGLWDNTINAAQVTTRYTGTYSFGRIFGLSTAPQSVTAQAVMAYAGATTCIRPVSIPYQSLLNQIYGTDASGNPLMGVSHDLTDADVDALRNAGPAMAVQLKLGNDATQGNFYILQMGPYAHSDGIALSPSPTFGGNNIFSDRFGGDCSNSPWLVGPGDWLEGKTGDANGPTESGYQELCGINITSNGTYSCPASLDKRSIKVAMWATENDGVCSPRCFQVKYVGVFVVTGYTKSAGTAPDGISGYFSTLATTGTFTDSPSPIQKIGLIK